MEDKEALITLLLLPMKSHNSIDWNFADGIKYATEISSENEVTKTNAKLKKYVEDERVGFILLTKVEDSSSI